MIISASRRTDIPCYYCDWFFDRIKEGYCLVRNPFNSHQVSKIDLSTDVVDCIVFWTKDVSPMIDKLYLIKDYKYYFQFTINSYGEDIENVISKRKEKIIYSFKRLSDKIGNEKVLWRYDPIILSDKYSIDYHKKHFEYLIKELHNYTKKCIISFVDIYKKIENKIKDINIKKDDEHIFELSSFISDIAKYYNITVEACCEDLPNIGKSKCIDENLISKIVGYNIKAKKDKNQRLNCGCVESIDIGAYNTCLSDCIYCYANSNKKSNITNSPILGSNVNDLDIVTERKCYSLKE